MAKTCNLVLAGGGVKGIALVGAIEALEAAGYRFQRVAGTSAGAVVGGLVAAGFRGEELRQIMHRIPYERFRDEGLLSRLGLPGKLAALYFQKGIYQGDYFCRWYEELLDTKGVNTFGDIQYREAFSDQQPYPFVAIAANISRGRLVQFPRDVREYQIKPHAQSIPGAVRASISLPGFYRPVKLGGDYLIDGGLLMNFPYNCFGGDDIPTIGIKLSAGPGASDREHPISGPFSYGEAVLKTMLNAQDQIHLEDPDTVANTVFVDTGSIMTTDFDLSPQQQQMLYEAGGAAADKFIHCSQPK